MSQCSIRQARVTDATAMHRVRLSVTENRLVSMALTEQHYIAAIQQTGRGWVAELDGEIVGFAVGNAQTGNVWALFVEPGHEGKGYGRQLHDVMVAWLWKQGLGRLWLTTDPGTRAERFYQQAGWARTSEAADGEVRFELTPLVGSCVTPLRADGGGEPQVKANE